MHVVTPTSRLRRGVRRFALTICALVLGAGFAPALSSTVDSPAPIAGASVTFGQQSTVDAPVGDSRAGEPPAAVAAPAVSAPAALPLPDGLRVGAVAGRAPPRTSA